MDSEAEKQAVKVGLDGAAGHFQLARDFGVVASLQKKFDDLLLAGTEPDR